MDEGWHVRTTTLGKGLYDNNIIEFSPSTRGIAVTNALWGGPSLNALRIARGHLDIGCKRYDKAFSIEGQLVLSGAYDVVQPQGALFCIIASPGALLPSPLSSTLLEQLSPKESEGPYLGHGFSFILVWKAEETRTGRIVR